MLRTHRPTFWLTDASWHWRIDDCIVAPNPLDRVATENSSSALLVFVDSVVLTVAKMQSNRSLWDPDSNPVCACVQREKKMKICWECWQLVFASKCVDGRLFIKRCRCGSWECKQTKELCDSTAWRFANAEKREIEWMEVEISQNKQ